jgi:hypothetical protein
MGHSDGDLDDAGVGVPGAVGQRFTGHGENVASQGFVDGEVDGSGEARPGCDLDRVLVEATGRCVRCSRRCTDCGGPVRTPDATMCRPCLRKAARQPRRAPAGGAAILGSCVPTPLGAERVPDPARRRIRRGPARCAVSSDDIPGWACALAAGGPTPTARSCVGITSLPSWTTHRRGCASSSATSLPGIAQVLPGPGRRDDTVSATPWSWSGWSPAPSGVHRPREARSLTAHQAAYSAGDGGSGAYLWKGLCSAQITEFRRLRDGC